MPHYTDTSHRKNRIASQFVNACDVHSVKIPFAPLLSIHPVANVRLHHLARIYKSVTGQTPIQRQNAICLEEAKQLLPMPNLPEREIGNG